MNNLRNIFASALIVCTYANTILALQAQNQPVLRAQKAKLDMRRSNPSLKGNVAYKPLQGGISLSRTMAAIPAALHKGAIFDKANIPKTPKNTDWYRIPSWMAGEWHRETFTTSFFGIPVAYKERADHLWGHQIDRLGGIWHHRNEPFVQKVEMDNYVYLKTISLQEPLSISDSKVIMHYKDTTVQYNKYSHAIVKTYRHEQISEISKQDNQLFEKVRGRDFDEAGFGHSDWDATTTYTLTKSFHPMDSDKSTKLNLKEDFKLYLASHGLSDRIPNQDTKITITKR
jgi:hypothetical protein